MSQLEDTNALLAEQARSVVAGVLAHPDAWGRVCDLVGDVLEPVKLRANPWARTAWRALVEIAEANVTPDVLLLREKMQALASLGRPELLSAWTRADDEGLRDVVGLMPLALSPLVVVDAAERLVTTFAASEFASGLASAQRELLRDPLADPHAVLGELQSRLQATCRRASRVPLDNAAEQTRIALSVARPDVIATCFRWLDEYSGGQDLGQITLFGARTGVGKSVFLQAQARNFVFPDSAKPVRNVKERLRVNVADDRPYLLVVSCENPKRMFYERLACDMLDIDGKDMRRDRLAAVDFSNSDPERVYSEDYIDALAQYGRMTVIDEDDLPDISASSVAASVAMWVDSILAQDPDATMWVGVDYLQRIDADEDQGREQRSRQIELATKQLKDVVRNKGVACTVAVQLNDSWDNAEPQRSETRDSKGGNNEAGNIWLAHRWNNAQAARIRETYQGEDGRKREQCMSVFSDKARNGQAGWRAIFTFDGPHYRIVDAPEREAGKPPKNWLRDIDTQEMAKPDRKAKKGEGLTLGDDPGPFG